MTTKTALPKNVTREQCVLSVRYSTSCATYVDGTGHRFAAVYVSDRTAPYNLTYRGRRFMVVPAKEARAVKGRLFPFADDGRKSNLIGGDYPA